MLWREITGQDAAVRFLRSALAADRVPSLLLFTGQPGVGKRTTARVFAAAALCESDEIPEEACGSCSSCREAAAGVHADLILPRVKLSEAKHSEEFRDLTDDDRLITLTRTVRPLLQDLRLRSARGGRRVVLIRRAERMNEESQNVLLKSLEEPEGELVWILTADDPARLLETVRSRATKVRFGRIPTEILAERLAAGGRLTPDRAREVAVAAEGSFARASEILSEGWQADRDFVESEIIRRLGADRRQGPLIAQELVGRVKSRARGEKGLEAPRRSALRLVGVLAWALRDRLRESVGASPAESSAFAEALKAVLESEAALRQNVRVELALTVAGSRLARAGEVGLWPERT